MPAKSESQRRAAGAALAAKRKRSPKGLTGAAKQMYKSMTTKQLEEFAAKRTKK